MTDPSLVEARQLAEDTLDGTLPYEETWHENATNLLSALDALGRKEGKAETGMTAAQSSVVEAAQDQCVMNEQAVRMLVSVLDHWEEMIECIPDPFDPSENELEQYLRSLIEDLATNELRAALAALSSSDSGHRQADQRGTADAVPGSEGDKA